MIAPEKIRRLRDYEEAAGHLLKLVVKNGILIAHVGKVHLALPTSLEQSLRPIIGQKITILRTDLPQEEFLFRVLSEEVESSMQ